MSIFNYNLLNLPFLRGLGHLATHLYFRGERGGAARGLLFHDLAEALRLGTPLDQALELIGTGHERVVRPFIPLGTRADYLLFSPDQMVKLLAGRLHPEILRGLTLSEAMMRLGKIFSRQEIAIIRMGENFGLLPQALKRLADYRQTDRRLHRLHACLIYPFYLSLLAVSVVSFIMIFILPKFEDLFAQLGGKMPPLTQGLIRVSSLVGNHLAEVTTLLSGGLITWIVASMMVHQQTGTPVLYHLPLLRKLYRMVRDARWLAAFTLQLEAGGGGDVALLQAGGITGGEQERRSREAARLVGKGIAIGEACVREGVLDPWINNRLALIDWRGNYIENVRGIVEDADRRASGSVERIGRRLEVLAIVTIAVIVGLTAMAIYLPLFSIPKLISFYY